MPVLEPGVILSFADCSTRAAALAKYVTWLDAHLHDLVRAHGAQLVADDRDCTAIAAQMLDLADDLARQREDLIARFERILDEASAAPGADGPWV
jgi:hypothetical protein